MHRRNLVFHIISGLPDGGAESTLFGLLVGDTECEHVVVSMTTEGKYGGKLRRNGVEVICLRIDGIVSLLPGLTLLFRILRARKPRVVQTWMYHGDLLGGVIAKLAGVPCIIWGVHHASLSLSVNKKSVVLIAFLSALFSYLIPKKIIASSRVVVDCHTKIGYAKWKFRTIECGVDVSKFYPSCSCRTEVREYLGVLREDPLIGMVARFNVIKNHEYLISAFAKIQMELPNAKLLLVGDGISFENEKLLQMVAVHGVEKSVMFIGSVENPRKYFNAMDVHVLTSTSESFGLVVLEALACKTLCVSTNVGMCKEFLKDVGFVSKLCDVDDLCESIKKCIRMSSVEMDIRKAKGKDRVLSSYSLKSTRKSYFEMWRLGFDL